MRQQARRSPLITYSSSKLRTLPSGRTSPPNGEAHRTGVSLSALHQLPIGSSHQHLVSARIETDQHPDEAHPLPALRAKRNRVNKKTPQELPATVTLKDLERAKVITPVTRRHDKRRRQMQTQTKVPSRPFKFSYRCSTKQYLQDDDYAMEEQISRDVLQTVVDQKNGSQGLVARVDSLSLEENVRNAHQKPQNLLTITSVDLGTTFEEKPENEESVDSDRNFEQEEQDEELDEIEKEILHLGEDGDGGLKDSNDPGPKHPTRMNDAYDSRDLNARSPKRHRSSIYQSSPDLFDWNYNIEADDEAFEQPTPKKQRRTSRRNSQAEAREESLQELKGQSRSKKSQAAAVKLNKPKKKARSLPVDELVIMSERFEDSDAEGVDEDPIEPPEDPISPSSSPLAESGSKRNGNKCSRTLNISLGRRKIDTSEFRMPKRQAGTQSKRSYSHSDGFVGHEAEPTGKFMLAGKQHRRQQIWHTLTVRMGELTLVVDRPSSSVIAENQAQPRKNTVTKARNCSEPAKNSERRTSRASIEVTESDYLMLVDDGDQSIVEDVAPVLAEPAPATGSAKESHDAFEPPVDGEKLLEQPQDFQSVASRKEITPWISGNESGVLDFPSRSHQLKQKEEYNYKFTSGKTVVQLSRFRSPQSGRPSGGRESNEINVSQQVKINSASKKVEEQQRKKIDVPLQLMMVTIPRSSMKESDSETDSDSENDREYDAEADSEVSSDSDEEERSDTPQEDSAEEFDDELAEAAEKEDMEIFNGEPVAPGSPKALEQKKPPYANNFEREIPPTAELAVPTLSRQDAQNPILVMSPKQIQLRPNTRRRSSRLQQHQLALSDDLLLNTVNNMTTDKPQERERHESVRRRSAAARDSDSSWRPRQPKTGRLLMEVENDEIIDSPVPVPNSIAFKSSVITRPLGSLRHLSRIANQPLQFPTSPDQPGQITMDSQGSVELGDTQRLLRGGERAYIAETQSSNLNQEPKQEEVEESEDEEEPDVPSSKMSFVPQNSYFEQASQDLRKPVRRPNVVRRKSMPASMHPPNAPESSELMAGGITMAEAFQRTISPWQSRSKSIGGVTSTLLTATPRSEKSPKTLTRQASRSSGMLPSSARKRMVSLPFVPPFKK